jgi:hypothetical protein
MLEGGGAGAMALRLLSAMLASHDEPKVARREKATIRCGPKRDWENPRAHAGAFSPVKISTHGTSGVALTQLRLTEGSRAAHRGYVSRVWRGAVTHLP